MAFPLGEAGPDGSGFLMLGKLIGCFLQSLSSVCISLGATWPANPNTFRYPIA